MSESEHLPNHYIIDIAFGPRFGERVRANVTAHGTPFPLDPTSAARLLSRRTRAEIGRVVAAFSRERNQVEARRGGEGSSALEDAPVWCLDLEARDMEAFFALDALLEFEEFDDVVLFVCWFCLLHDPPNLRTPEIFARPEGEAGAEEERARYGDTVLLDLDGTLLDDQMDFRPGALDFITRLAEHVEVGLWSASSLGRVWSVAEDIETRTGIKISPCFGVDRAIGWIFYDPHTGQLAAQEYISAFRKPLDLARSMGFDPARVLLIDDAAEHWSGQYNQLAVIPPPPLPGGKLDLDAVWDALLAHVERSFDEPDVRLAPRFCWSETWFDSEEDVPWMFAAWPALELG